MKATIAVDTAVTISVEPARDREGALIVLVRGQPIFQISVARGQPGDEELVERVERSFHGPA